MYIYVYYTVLCVYIYICKQEYERYTQHFSLGRNPVVAFSPLPGFFVSYRPPWCDVFENWTYPGVVDVYTIHHQPEMIFSLFLGGDS